MSKHKVDRPAGHRRQRYGRLWDRAKTAWPTIILRWGGLGLAAVSAAGLIQAKLQGPASASTIPAFDRLLQLPYWLFFAIGMVAVATGFSSVRMRSAGAKQKSANEASRGHLDANRDNPKQDGARSERRSP